MVTFLPMANQSASHKRSQLYTLCLKKGPNFKLSVTLSNRNRFSKFLYCWKAHEIWYKSLQQWLPHLRHVAALPWETKNSNFLQIFRADMKENANKLHFYRL